MTDGPWHIDGLLYDDKHETHVARGSHVVLGQQWSDSCAASGRLPEQPAALVDVHAWPSDGGDGVERSEVVCVAPPLIAPSSTDAVHRTSHGDRNHHRSGHADNHRGLGSRRSRCRRSPQHLGRFVVLLRIPALEGVFALLLVQHVVRGRGGNHSDLRGAAAVLHAHRGGGALFQGARRCRELGVVQRGLGAVHEPHRVIPLGPAHPAPRTVRRRREQHLLQRGLGPEGPHLIPQRNDGGFKARGVGVGRGRGPPRRRCRVARCRFGVTALGVPGGRFDATDVPFFDHKGLRELRARRRRRKRRRHRGGRRGRRCRRQGRRWCWGHRRTRCRRDGRRRCRTAGRRRCWTDGRSIGHRSKARSLDPKPLTRRGAPALGVGVTQADGAFGGDVCIGQPAACQQVLRRLAPARRRCRVAHQRG
mmetsp:Transcript_32370/g.84738  ORF Transcript_32370/g.84738 Transcript_32370/m.84738 type:complete len:420 (+) Transcript_32370:81-1340(+)